MRALLLVAAVVSSLAARPLRAQEDAQEDRRDDAVESAVAHLLDADVPRREEPDAIAGAVTLGPKVGTRLLERFFEVTVAEAGERWHREDTATRERRVLAVLRGLARGAEPAVARLIAETKDPPPETRDVVWRWILELGPWVPYLAEELRALAPPEHAQREWDIWDWASWERFQAGLRIGPDAPLEELITVLEDGECLAIEFAAEVLKERGPSAAAALEPLAAVLARAGEVAVLHQGGSSLYRVPSFRYLLEDALAAIAPADARALPGLRRQLDRYHTLEERIAAARALGGLAAVGAQAVPALADVCRAEEDPRLLCAALEALGALGPATAAVPEGIETLTAFDDAELWGAEIAAAAHAALARVR